MTARERKLRQLNNCIPLLEGPYILESDNRLVISTRHHINMKINCLPHPFSWRHGIERYLYTKITNCDVETVDLGEASQAEVTAETVCDRVKGIPLYGIQIYNFDDMNMLVVPTADLQRFADISCTALQQRERRAGNGLGRQGQAVPGCRIAATLHSECYLVREGGEQDGSV